MEELRIQGSLRSIISGLYPKLTQGEIEEVESGIHDALLETKPLISLLDFVLDPEAEKLRSHNQPITPVQATQNLIPVTDRKPRKGDRIRHFGGKFGTLQEVTKGLAKYHIQWDGAKKSEVYSQKEFNRLDFEIFAPAIEDQVPVHEVDQSNLELHDENYYRGFRFVLQTHQDVGYSAEIFHPSGAPRVKEDIPVTDIKAAIKWIEALIDAEFCGPLGVIKNEQ